MSYKIPLISKMPDYKEDYELIKIIYEKLYPKNKYFGMEEIIKFLQSRPSLMLLNSKYSRNEGYNKQKR